jgi:hypothetical protein
MSALRSTEAQVRGSLDPFWWGMAALLSLGSAWLPKFLNLEGDQFTRLLVVESALFFSGAVLGCVRPQRPWRWAAATILAFAARDVVSLLGVRGLVPVGVPDAIVLVLSHSGAYCLFALPVLLGALLGASMMGAGLR